ncbi:MAG: NAD(P)H-dependent oxidoreductase [Propionibacteriaceae bacterium]|nr:NAD(P)H-dependent oxidoreductase [Propionibacteriaceae bacterium]
MHVHIVFAHPSHESFTGRLLDTLVRGLDDAGHTHTISDLYAMNFNPVLDGEGYLRESRLMADVPVPADVADEQAKLEAADVWVFLYTVWWSDCPAILKGWFDRVWTVGYAYEPGHLKAKDTSAEAQIVSQQKIVQQAFVLCTAGHSEEELRSTGLYQGMEAVMLTDRISTRATHRQFIVFGGSTTTDPEVWAALRQSQMDRAYHLGYDLG